MKTKIIVLLSLFAAISSVRAITIAQWTFETSLPATVGPIAPEAGTGIGTAYHTSAATAYSNPAGNGSGESWSANNWAIGDYWQFQLSTAGYSGIGISFDQVGSSTGPRDFTFGYSTDGSSFTTFASYSLSSSVTSWISGSANPLSSFAFDLAAVKGIDNSSTVYFRLVDNSGFSISGGAVGSAGSDRVDNFKVSGTKISDTGTTAVLLSIPLLGLFTLRRLTIRPV